MSRGLFPGQGAAPEQTPARRGDALGVWLGPVSAPLTQPASPRPQCALTVFLRSPGGDTLRCLLFHHLADRSAYVCLCARAHTRAHVHFLGHSPHGKVSRGISMGVDA